MHTQPHSEHADIQEYVCVMYLCTCMWWNISRMCLSLELVTDKLITSLLHVIRYILIRWLKFLQGVQFHPESIITSEGKIIVSNFIKMIERKEAESES
jgi:hypothetical protein